MANNKSEISSQVLNYLISLSQLDGTGMTKLAGLTLIQDFLKSDKNGRIKKCFLEHGLLDSLMMALDDGSLDGKLAFLEVSLKSLFYLSQLPVGPLQPLLSESLIRRLLMLLDTKEIFYQYSSSVKLTCQKLVENKHLIGNVSEVKVNSAEWTHLHRVYRSSLKILPKLGVALCKCSLILSSDDEAEMDNISVCDYLVMQKLVWPVMTAGSNSSTENSTDKNWKDIIVTHILEGPLFWAQVGLSSIHSVQKIQAKLDCVHEKGNLHPCGTCKKDDIVVVCHRVEDIQCFIRARVLSVDVMIVTLWALDYGYILTTNVDLVYTVPDNIHIDRLPPQVTLCCLEGVQEPPLDTSVVHTAVAILCNLCKISYPAGKIVEKLGGLEICEAFLSQCPDNALNIEVIQLVNNLACNQQLSKGISETRLVETVIGKCKEFYKSEDVKTQQDMLTKMLACLYSLLYKNEENRYKFYHFEGLETVLKCSMIAKRHSGMYNSAVKCLSEFLNSVNQYSTSGRGRTAENRQHMSDIPGEIGKLMSYTPDNEKKGLQKPIEKALEEHHLFQDQSSDEETMNKKTVMSLKETTVTVNVADMYNEMCPQSSYYVKDGKVSFEADATHELRPNQSIEKVSSSVIVQHVCGMLNSGKGGTIYFGITPARRVQGVIMNRDSRDEFRLGVDRMMTNNLQPCLVHSLFDVVYVPVIECQESKFSPVENLYVTEIQMKPSKGILYTLKPIGTCFFRLGCHTISLSKQELRHLIILEEEECYRDKIQKLNLELQQLESMNAGQDTSVKTAI